MYFVNVYTPSSSWSFPHGHNQSNPICLFLPGSSFPHTHTHTHTPTRCSRRVQLEGAVTSIAMRGEGQQLLVGTDASQMYRFCYTRLEEPELISSSHSSSVTAVAIP